MFDSEAESDGVVDLWRYFIFRVSENMVIVILVARAGKLFCEGFSDLVFESC